MISIAFQGEKSPTRQSIHCKTSQRRKMIRERKEAMPCKLVWRLDTWLISGYMTGKGFRDRVWQKCLGKVRSVKASLLRKKIEEISNFSEQFGKEGWLMAKFPHSTAVDWLTGYTATQHCSGLTYRVHSHTALQWADLQLHSYIALWPCKLLHCRKRCWEGNSISHISFKD